MEQIRNMQIKRVKEPWNYGFQEDIEKAKITRADSNYCENCGHRQLLKGQDKYICRNCGHMVFRNEKVKFLYRLNEARAKEKRNTNGQSND